MAPSRLELTIAVALLLLGGAAVPARAADAGVDGRALYVQVCATCHGATGDGRGPVAVVLKTSPRDLRKLSRRYGDPLPVDRIAQLIDGRELVKAHGPREMPVWGDQLRERAPTAEAAEAGVRRRIEAIIAHLASIQTK